MKYYCFFNILEIAFDQIERWSDQAKDFFKLQLKDSPLLRVEVYEKNAETDVYKLCLFDRNGSLIQRLIDNRLARLN